MQSVDILSSTQVSLMSSLKANGSTSQWRKIRQRVLDRDQRVCQWCGSEDANTVDHVIERSMGGSDSEDNLVAACSRCNFSRVGKKSMEGGFFSGARTPLTLPVSILPENRSISHD